jgi:hypothetical protein
LCRRYPTIGIKGVWRKVHYRHYLSIIEHSFIINRLCCILQGFKDINNTET